MSAATPTLRVNDLTVAYRQDHSWLEAVRGVSLNIEAGQTYGLVGESGSGKTTLAMAIMRYLGPEGKVLQGTIEFMGRDLLALSEDEMRSLWGAEISLVPQNPLSALNPSLRIGEQLGEGLRHHEGLGPAQVQERVLHWLRMVRLPEPAQVAANYPHQISGGMQQRILIAMALSTSPRLLVLDEPTTSLDVTTQASILDLFRDLTQGLQTAALYVTHNLGVVAEICNRVAVLYAGELVEDAPLVDLFHHPLHPYTQGLLDSIPKLGEDKAQRPLRAIRGQIPPLGARLEGCVFAPRCPLAIEICRERPPLYQAGEGRTSRCHRWEEIASGQVSAHQPLSGISPSPASNKPAAPALSVPAAVLDARDVAVHFDIHRSVGELLAGEPPRKVRAVDGVSVVLPRGQTLGLVGESGSGKTTFARAVVGLVERTRGEIDLLGVALPEDLSSRSLETLRHLQMVFQNPEEALNPYLTVGASLRRPLQRLLNLSAQEAEAQVARLLQAVRLPAAYSQRMPGQLSGGEKQRVAIARAFASHPDLLIADEPVSSLDVSVQASVLNLLNDLQAESGNSLVFISHDLAVVRYLADTIAVIYLGHLMEVSTAHELFRPPYHPYTEALISAIPSPEPDLARERIRLEGDIPSPSQVPTGCPFHTRCPRFLGEICVSQTPPWRLNPKTGARIFCHIPLEELETAQAPVKE